MCIWHLLTSQGKWNVRVKCGIFILSFHTPVCAWTRPAFSFSGESSAPTLQPPDFSGTMYFEPDTLSSTEGGQVCSTKTSCQSWKCQTVRVRTFPYQLWILYTSGSIHHHSLRDFSQICSFSHILVNLSLRGNHQIFRSMWNYWCCVFVFFWGWGRACLTDFRWHFPEDAGYFIVLGHECSMWFWKYLLYMKFRFSTLLHAYQLSFSGVISFPQFLIHLFKRCLLFIRI